MKNDTLLMRRLQNAEGDETAGVRRGGKGKGGPGEEGRTMADRTLSITRNKRRVYLHFAARLIAEISRGSPALSASNGAFKLRPFDIA